MISDGVSPKYIIQNAENRKLNSTLLINCQESVTGNIKTSLNIHTYAHI